tara:strand:+ start:5781 stop:6155 length:375 start_codon:yes stop_codon:yes gene_type:complete
MTQERKNAITPETPAVHAIDATVERMMRAITRRDAEHLLPLDPADDDLIQERIRIRLGECRKMLSHWIGHGVDNGRYEIMGRPWISRDGIEWIDARTSEPVDTEEFHNASITMFGGPCNGEVVG